MCGDGDYQKFTKIKQTKKNIKIHTMCTGSTNGCVDLDLLRD